MQAAHLCPAPAGPSSNCRLRNRDRLLSGGLPQCPPIHPVPTQDEDVLYREVVFNNHNKMPREKKPEETTYAELRNTSQEDDGLVYAMVTSNAKSKAKNLPQNIDPETTYAEVMPMSGTSEPRDGSNDTYATVNKNRPGRIAQDN